MAWRLPPLAVLLHLVAAAVAPLSSAVRPVSDAHRSVAAELFAASPDDLETTYEAVRTFKILGVQRDKGLDGKACKLAAHTLSSSSSSVKDLFHAVQIAGVLGCSVDAGVYDDVASRLKAVIKDTNSLLEFYYSVGGLLSLKEQGHSVVLSDADSTFHAIKALSQTDGRWRYDTNSAESGTFAAGIALEALAGVVSLSDAEVDPSMGARTAAAAAAGDKNLRFLLQKVLKQSDVGTLGRIVLPKKEAETHLPELKTGDGISIPIEDIGTSQVWSMRYRFWPNNKSRMYLLENTGDFVRSNELQEGDFIVLYSDVKSGKYLIRGVKVRAAQELAKHKNGSPEKGGASDVKAGAEDGGCKEKSPHGVRRSRQEAASMNQMAVSI